jgi:putative chitinase
MKEAAMCISDSVGVGGTNNTADVKTVQLLLNLNRARFALPAPLDADGRLGAKSSGALEAFQAQVMGLAPTDGRVAPGSATLAALAAGMPPGFSGEKLQGILINAPKQRVDRYAGPLASKMVAYAIDTSLRQAHFLAQLGHESGELRYTEELASGDAYEGRRDLGNTAPGDGQRFKGRGLIQLTGRANYQAYGDAIGRNLVDGDNPNLLATDPELAVDVACWFWQSHGLSDLADQDDVIRITKKINGGLNGLPERERLLGRGRFFLVG